MDNNDIVIRVRYALDIKDTDMVEIFELGGVEVTKEEIQKILTKSPDSYEEELYSDQIKVNNVMLDSFFNGFIVFKRGKQDPKPGQPDTPAAPVKKSGNMNNTLLKKLKIALQLTSEEMLDIFEKAGLTITKGELSAFLRKEGHKNYKECLDKYARNFLKGLAIHYRG
ncbi:DUF1456 family protein [Neobacillus vireti]|uniref:DUF1456 family protein n=1 Tax=Neobacillus vireti TaxID=220686 RepID=UPI00300007C7